MDSLAVLHPLNNYLSKKSATILRAVSKTTRDYIVPKNYRQQALKLNATDVAKITLIVNSPTQKFHQFSEIYQHLELFRYSTDVKYWTKKHWVFYLSFVAYNYHTNLPDNRFIDAQEFYETVFDDELLDELDSTSLITFMDYYNVINSFPLNVIKMNREFYMDEEYPIGEEVL